MPRQTEAAGAAVVVQFCKLFVGGVPQTMEEGELEVIFAQHAQVEKVWLQRHRTGGQHHKQHRGFGYVVYRDPDAADRLLGDRFSTFLEPSGGVRLEVKRALSSREIQSGGVRGPGPSPPWTCAAPPGPEPLFARWPPQEGGAGWGCLARGGRGPGPFPPESGAAPPGPEPLFARWPPQEGGAGWVTAQAPQAPLAAGGVGDASTPQASLSPFPSPAAQQQLGPPAQEGREDTSLGSLHEAALLRFRLGEPEPDSDEEVLPCPIARWGQLQ